MDTPLPPLQTTKPRRMPIVPILIILLCAGVIAWAQLANPDSIEGNFRGIYSLLAVVGALLLLGIWVLLLSGMRWGRRLKIAGSGLLLVILVGLGLKYLTRREGSFTGAGFPRLVWAWTPRHVVPPLQVSARLQTVMATPDDFPQFLGPQRDNQVRNVTLAPDWAAHPPQMLWRRQVGLGWSGFSTIGKYAVTMEQRDEQESTICYEIASGEPVWVHANAVYLHESEGGDGPRATPTIDHGRVYTLGGLGNLDCLDAATGGVIWSRIVLEDPLHQHLRYGQTSSPLIVDQMVIVTGGMSKPDNPRPSLLAFEKDTGKPLWQFIGDPASYASPSLVTLAGVRQILQVHQNYIAGHDLADGHLLWSRPWAPGFWPKNSQAVPVGGDRVYCSTGYGIGSLLLQIAANNGSLSATEIWHKTTMKTELSNIVLRGDYVLGLDDGYLTCQDLATGQKLWRGDRFGHGQILQAGDLLIAQSESGEIALVDASRAGATELGRFTALTKSDNCWNTPALAGHFLLVRNDKEAACYRLP